MIIWDMTKGDPICECKGGFIGEGEGYKREEMYEEQGQGSYIFFFSHKGKQYW